MNYSFGEFENLKTGLNIYANEMLWC